MKVLFLLLCLNFAFFQIDAQQWSGASNLTGDIGRTGNVGIGTTTPSYKLDVNGSAKLFQTLVNTSNTPFTNSTVIYSPTGWSNILGVDGQWTTKYFGMKADGTFIAMGGNVLIGKTSQINSAYILDVNGGIRSNKVVVNTTGADFVFEPGYKLPSLASVEKYINQYKHLPDIAPAKQMQNDGQDVGEMTTKLLQKVEELTLYVIELKKEIEALKSEKK